MDVNSVAFCSSALHAPACGRKKVKEGGEQSVWLGIILFVSQEVIIHVYTLFERAIYFNIEHDGGRAA